MPRKFVVLAMPLFLILAGVLIAIFATVSPTCGEAVPTTFIYSGSTLLNKETSLDTRKNGSQTFFYEVKDNPLHVKRFFESLHTTENCVFAPGNRIMCFGRAKPYGTYNLYQSRF
jgi:hypothetical protein